MIKAAQKGILTNIDIVISCSAMKALRFAKDVNNCCSDESRYTEPLYPGLEEAAKLFHALADETRLAILKQLRDRGEMCACEFSACCELAQPTVSHHLKVLREAGLVGTDKRGLWVYYSLHGEKLEALRALLP
jgi:ArsR family transcriptional regulator